MISKKLIFALLSAITASVLLAPAGSYCQVKPPGKLLFKDLYSPELMDSSGNVAYFKMIEEAGTAYSRLCVGDPATGEERILFPDIDFYRDKVDAFAFMPDGRHVALVDKNLTLCDIWLHDSDRPYAEPKRMTELERFSPGYTADQLYQLGMSPKSVMEVKDLDISHDGKKIIITLGIIGQTAIWMYEIDRDHYRQLTPERSGYLPTWFPDSENFVFTMADTLSGKFSEDIWMMEARTNKWQPLVATTNSESFATPSPDGNYVAYLEYVGGSWSPRVVRVSDRKIAKVLDLPLGKSGSNIIWNADGTRLYVVISGYEKKPCLYEVPFDKAVFD